MVDDPRVAPPLDKYRGAHSGTNYADMEQRLIARMSPGAQQEQQAQRGPTAFEELEARVKDLENFIKYAGDVSPDFGKLLTAFQAKKKLGIRG